MRVEQARGNPADHEVPLRLAYLTYRGKPHIGGQGVYTRHLTKALVDLGHEVEDAQMAALARVKADRDASGLSSGLVALRHAAEHGENLIPPMLACVRAYGTVQEISEALVPVFGTYREVSVL